MRDIDKISRKVFAKLTATIEDELDTWILVLESYDMDD